MKAKCNKSLCTIGAILAAIAAIFFLVPLKSYKACKEAHNGDHSFFAHCSEYWKSKFHKEENNHLNNIALADAPSKQPAAPAEEKAPEAEGKLLTPETPAEDEEA